MNPAWCQRTNGKKKRSRLVRPPRTSAQSVDGNERETPASAADKERTKAGMSGSPSTEAARRTKAGRGRATQRELGRILWEFCLLISRRARRGGCHCRGGAAELPGCLVAVERHKGSRRRRRRRHHHHLRCVLFGAAPAQRKRRLGGSDGVHFDLEGEWGSCLGFPHPIRLLASTLEADESAVVLSSWQGSAVYVQRSEREALQFFPFCVLAVEQLSLGEL